MQPKVGLELLDLVGPPGRFPAEHNRDIVLGHVDAPSSRSSAAREATQRPALLLRAPDLAVVEKIVSLTVSAVNRNGSLVPELVMAMVAHL